MKKIGHRVGVRRITHPDAATTNNVRTGRSPARLANFISLSGQALNFGASIIALVCALRVLQPVFLFLRCLLSSSSTFVPVAMTVSTVTHHLSAIPSVNLMDSISDPTRSFRFYPCLSEGTLRTAKFCTEKRKCSKTDQHRDKS